MDNPLKLFNQGRLADAVQAAGAAVRREPSDVAARFILAELLCFEGQWERADRHLETVADLSLESAIAVSQFRRILHAEVARQDFFASGRPPEFLTDPTPALRARLEAAVCLREKDVRQAREKLEEAERWQGAAAGTCDGRPFPHVRDADDLVGGVFEVLMADGRYFWVPCDRIVSLTFKPPRRPRDILFREARLELRNDVKGEVFLPTLYAGTAGAAADDSLKLGRATTWTDEAEGPVRGTGQRLLVFGEDAQALLDVHEIVFTPPAPDEGKE